MAEQRHIVVLIDGTTRAATNGLRRYFTNVFRVGRSVAENNVVFLYFPGPATRRMPLRCLNIASGVEVKAILLEAYLALCTNINSDEDKIYIFGYSRGGAIAKALACMVDKSGLLKRQDTHLLKHAWAFYFYGRATNEAAIAQKKYVKHIEFLGIFDAVLGPRVPFIELEFRVEPDLPEIVRHAVEIISADDRRWEFKPTPWRTEKVKGSRRNPFVAPSFRSSPPRRFQQIWMPGGHADVGDPNGDAYISDIAFLTLIERLHALTSLPIDRNYVTRIFEDTLATTRRMAIVSNRRPFFNAQRKISETGVAEYHPLISWLVGRNIFDSNIVRRYRSSLEQLDFYDMRLRAILAPGRYQIPEISLQKAVHDLLSQVD